MKTVSILQLSTISAATAASVIAASVFVAAVSVVAVTVASPALAAKGVQEKSPNSTKAENETLQEKITKIAQKKGESSIDLIPVMLKLSTVTSSNETPHILERALALCESHQKKDSEATVIAMYKSAFKSISGTSNNASAIVFDRLVSSFEKYLIETNNLNELQLLEQLVVSEQGKRNAVKIYLAEEALRKASERKEVAPVDLIIEQINTATIYLKAHQAKKAYELLNQALTGYGDLPASVGSSALDEKLWSFAKIALRMAKTKADEQFVYRIVDVQETNNVEAKNNFIRSGSGVYDTAKYFMEKRRVDDAMEFLNYVLDKRKRLKPESVDEINSVSTLMRTFYLNEGDKENALKTAREQLVDLSKDSKHGARRLVDLAAFFVQTKQLDLAQNAINQAIQMLDENVQFYAHTSIYQAFERLSREFIRIDQQQDADALLRKLFQLAKEHPKEFSGETSLLQSQVIQLSDHYWKNDEYLKAESLIELAATSSPFQSNQSQWSRELSEIYLRHAGKLNSLGKTAEAKEKLALSEVQFKLFLQQYSAASHTEEQIQYIENFRGKRLKLLRQFGFEKSEALVK